MALFRDDPNVSDLSIGRSASQAAPTVIGKGVAINGTVRSGGRIILEGRLEGEVRCDVITINEGGELQGNIIAKQAIVDGRVSGKIWTLELNLKQSAELRGDVFQKALSIEPGAHFVGTSRRLEDPIAEAPTSDAVAAKPGNDPLVAVNKTASSEKKRPQAAE